MRKVKKLKRVVVQKENCVSCRACELACAFAHTGTFNPRKSAIRLSSAHSISAVPILCLQCVKPLCAEACLEGALVIADEKSRETTGAVLFDPSKCTGCGLCCQACRFHAMFSDPGDGKAIRCDLCGGDPTCVKYCQKDALRIV